ncbi:hypothetical protein LJC72_12360 [Bacteroides sp. OttesenSCG-928-D19]|nr:hypothetical protein [Bacteroides sp. OttesenSCG-928-N06]MDL2306110.1 hypothetical protein [Bacteroides sp. OttesenSCG-928-D19]
MKNSIKLLLSLLIGLAGCSLDDDGVFEPSLIEGVVTNIENKPMGNVTVELVTLSGSKITTTNQSGKYSFQHVRTGIGVLNFSFSDYYPISRRISINKDYTPDTDVILRNFLDDYYLTSSTISIGLKNTDTKAKFRVSSNAGFSVECKAEWLKMETVKTEWEAIINLSCEQNEAEKVREAMITIRGDYGKMIEVVVIQQPGPILKMTDKDNPGYIVKANRDGIVFHFTRSVEVEEIEKKGKSVMNDLTIEKLNEDKSIRLKGFKPENLFKSGIYTLSVRASDGIVISTDFEVWNQMGIIELPQANYIFLFNVKDDAVWDLNTFEVFTFPDMKKIGPIADKHVYTSIKYSAKENKMVGFRTKTSGIQYVNYYDGSTGRFIEEEKKEDGKNYNTDKEPPFQFDHSFSYTGKYYIVKDQETTNYWEKKKYYIFEGEVIKSLNY